MKKIIISIITTGMLTGLMADCSVLKTKVDNSMAHLSGTNSHDYYVKWAAISTAYIGLYTDCREQERHDEMLRSNERLFTQVGRLTNSNSSSLSVPSAPSSNLSGTGY